MAEESTDNWMPFWIGDYLKSTMSFDAAEHGAYMLLIMHHWTQGPIPDDDRELSKIARTSPKDWAKIRPKLAAKFLIENGFWTQERAAKEKTKAEQLTEARRAAANARWGNREGEGDAKQHAKRNAKRGAKPDANPDATPMQTNSKRHDHHHHIKAKEKEKAAAASTAPVAREAPTVDPPASPPPPPAVASLEDRARAIGALLAGRGVQAVPAAWQRMAAEGRTDEAIGKACDSLEQRLHAFSAVLVADRCAEEAHAPPVNGFGAEFAGWPHDERKAEAYGRALGIGNARPGESWPQFHARIRAAEDSHR